MNKRKQIDVDEILASVPDYIQKVQCDTNEGTLPFKCAVKSCSNSFFSFKERDKYFFKFHNFPHNECLRNIWKEQCGWKKNANITTRLKVCSDHFDLDDYIRNYKEEFKNPNFKRKLKSDAIPRRNIKINNIKMNTAEEENLMEAFCAIPLPCSHVNEDKERANLSKDIKMAVDHNESLNKDISQLLAKEKDLKEKLQTCEKKIKLANNELRSMKIEDVIHKVFSDAQINVLMGRKKVYWSHDDLAEAFILRHIGTKECYLYLKNTLNIPLPTLSCIQKWAASNHLS